jgi:hypothetical protein
MGVTLECVGMKESVMETAELLRLDANRGSSAGLVLVTTFTDLRSMGRFLGDIAWETEVWVAEAPDHLIHFNGERFLGPYE